MTRNEVISANPIADFVRSRGHVLHSAGENFVTNGCPVRLHKRDHRPVMIYPKTQSWWCHDCKVGRTVIDWVMREQNVTAADAMRSLNGDSENKQLVATYDYTDEKGNLLYQSLRYKVPPPKNKTFLQRHPGSNGSDWVWNMKGVRRVLYHLRQVLAAQTVVVVEGEKDADNVSKYGFTATTNVGGAGKWRDEYSEVLKGKDVVVFGDIGDNDKKGENHTQAILRSLTGKARSLKHAIQPPGFHDVSDWIATLYQLARGEETQTIQALIDETPEVEAHSFSVAEPEPVELPPPPPPYVPPPLDLFPDSVQRFIRAGAATFDVDRAFFLLPVLSGGAAMIANTRSIRLKEDYIEPPIIWSAYIAPTGDGKSPVLQAATAPLRLRERELIRQNKEAYAQFATDLAKWEARSKKDRAAEEKPQKPPVLTCLMDDATIEAVASRLNDNPRGIALVKDELSHWFESFDQYHDRGGADVSRWLMLWMGNLFAMDRVTKGRSYRIANPRVSISGGVVPDKFKQLLTDDFFARGLPARFLFAMPTRNQPRKWVDKSIPKEVKAAVNELFAKLGALQPHKNDEPALLGLSAEVKEIFADFYNECARHAFEADTREAAQWSKLSAYSARLALVGQLMRDPDASEISGDVMRAACDLARWFGNEAERIYALIAETPEQRERRRLIEFIERHGGAATVREVITYYRPLRNNRDEAERQLNALVRARHGEWMETKGACGPAIRKFQLLPVSASAGFAISPSIAPKPADADTPSSQENEVHSDPDVAPQPGDQPRPGPESEAFSGDLQL